MLKNRIVTFSVFTQPGPVSFQSFRITSTVSNATQDHDITNCIMQYRAILCTFDEAYRPRMGAIFLQSTLTKVSGSRSGASIEFEVDWNWQENGSGSRSATYKEEHSEPAPPFGFSNHFCSKVIGASQALEGPKDCWFPFSHQLKWMQVVSCVFGKRKPIFCDNGNWKLRFSRQRAQTPNLKGTVAK